MGEGSWGGEGKRGSQDIGESDSGMGIFAY